MLRINGKIFKANKNSQTYNKLKKYRNRRKGQNTAPYNIDTIL